MGATMLTGPLARPKYSSNVMMVVAMPLMMIKTILNQLSIGTPEAAIIQKVSKIKPETNVPRSAL